jgi:predicted HicB family RNase H-like nuclease
MTQTADRLIQEFPALAPPAKRVPRQVVFVRMPVELHEKIVELSAHGGVTMNRLCVAMLEDGVRRVAGVNGGGK